MADLKIGTDAIVGSLLGTPSITSRTPTFGPFDAAGTATVLFFLSVCSVATPHCVNYRASSPLSCCKSHCATRGQSAMPNWLLSSDTSLRRNLDEDLGHRHLQGALRIIDNPLR